MAFILLLTGSHLCHNPRVFKEATALAAAGFSVEVLGAWLDPELKARDQSLAARMPFRFTPVLDATTQPWAWRKSRLRVKAARLWHQYTGRETAWQLGYVTHALTRAVRLRRCQTDLFVAHSEPALWAAAQLQRRLLTSDNETRGPEVSGQWSVVSGSRFCVGVDMEDWFSEDLPPETRRHRPVQLLKSLERGVLNNAAHASCTSQAMSEALAKEYECPPPKVIYNAFPWADRQSLDGEKRDRRDLGVPSIHWYSQTLGTDRGLGDLFAALPSMKHEAKIHLRGKPVAGFERWMMDRVPETWRKRIFIHGLVSNDELLSRIAEHDIGFAGELRYCKNKEFTVSNKVLHYLLGGLAVVASDTVGQKEIAAKADGAVRTYCSGDAASLANELNTLLSSAETLRAAKSAALVAAEKEFCWERQAPLLLQSISDSLVSDG